MNLTSISNAICNTFDITGMLFVRISAVMSLISQKKFNP